MPPKNIFSSVEEWFIKNMIGKRMFIIDKPGFTYTQFYQIGFEIFQRTLIFPDEIFARLEKVASKEVLYKAGKNFGYTYAETTYPFLDKSKGNIEAFLVFTFMYLRTMYSPRMEYEVNLENPENPYFIVHMNDYVICRTSGLGYLMGAGGFCCVLSGVLSNPKIEGSQAKCAGRGDPECILIAARPETIKEKFPDAEIIIHNDIIKTRENTSVYRAMNKVVDIAETSSLADMINTRTFSYAEGILKYKNERLFPCDISMLYILESMLSEEECKKLYDISFEWGYNISKDVTTEPSKYIRSLLGALGWGEIMIINKENEYEVVCCHFPWSSFIKNYKFPLFSGLISGMLSGTTKKDVKLDVFSHGEHDNNFTVSLKKGSNCV